VTADKAEIREFLRTLQSAYEQAAKCPTCGAAPDTGCVNPRTGGPVGKPHPNRAGNTASVYRAQRDQAAAYLRALLSD
jgi:hypothetical protein